VEQRYGAVLCKSGPSGPRSRPPHPASALWDAALEAPLFRDASRLPCRDAPWNPTVGIPGPNPWLRRTARHLRLAFCAFFPWISLPRAVFRNSGFAARS